MRCRAGCGACCIAPSITSPLPGMPNGKPAGVACVYLSEDFLCKIFGQAGRPQVCSDFSAEISVCGETREEAIQLLGWLEQATGS